MNTIEIVIRDLYISEGILSSLVKVSDNVVRGYSLMKPETTPRATLNEVVDDFLALPKADKIRILDIGGLWVYVHFYASVDHVTPYGYNAVKGECLSTDEAYSYDFNTKKWNWETDVKPDYIVKVNEC